jgi:hypothetical protein
MKLYMHVMNAYDVVVRTRAIDEYDEVVYANDERMW